MKTKNIIEQKLKTLFNPAHLEVINESNNHNVPAGSESHFKVIMVSTEFDNKMLIARHRAVNDALADELKILIHALTMYLYTPEEWQEKHDDSFMSPPCMGGSNFEQ